MPRAVSKQAQHLAAISRLLLSIFDLGLAVDGRRSNAARVFREWHVAMVIRVNDGIEGRRPISISQLARATGLSRPVVRRAIKGLLARGRVVVSDDGGYVGNQTYYTDNVDAGVYLALTQAVMDCAAELNDLHMDDPSMDDASRDTVSADNVSRLHR